MNIVSKAISFVILFGGFLLPQSPAEDPGALLVKAINSDSETEQAEIITEIFSRSAIAEVGMERLRAFLRRMHSDYAPLSYHHSEVLAFEMPGGTSRIMHVYARKPGAVMWKDFQMRLDPEPPHWLKSVGFIAEVSEPVALPNGSIEQKATLDWLSAYVERLRSEYDLSGSLLIAKGDAVLIEACFGHEDPGRKRPVGPGTLFNMASGGKMFTALCVAKLVEQGKLGYDDPVTGFLDGYPDGSKAGRITIHHLLSHTSGVAEYWSGQNDKAVHSATTIDDHLKLVYGSGFEFEPGSAYRYANSNYILLGAIIEKVTGRSFSEFVRETVFDPAGMSSSGYFDHASKNTAIPLARGKSEKDWIEARHGIRGSSAGGAYSHSRDILRFSEALRMNRIVSRQAFENMISAKNSGIKEAGDFDYGYGFILSRSAQESGYGHGGTADGVNFEFRYFPGSDTTLVVFSNQNNGAYDDLKKNAIKLITGHR